MSQCAQQLMDLGEKLETASVQSHIAKRNVLTARKEGRRL